jgi:hypothetical protein
MNRQTLAPTIRAKHPLVSQREGLNMDWKEHGVKIVHAGELDINTPQSPG